MILVCAGPDTFQALRKARELERAYREKYDPTGISIERISSTKSLEVLAERMGSVGLFSQRRCLRATNLVSSWKKADWDRAAKLFARDAEQTIVISVEDEISPETEKVIASWDRSRVYRHYVKVGSDFDAYAEQLVKEYGIEQTPELRAFARAVEGDAWTFWNALPRYQATKTLPAANSAEVSAFSKTDQYLLGANDSRLSALEGDEDLLPLMLQQARQGLRVVAGQPDPRTPAFALRKWQRLSSTQSKAVNERTRAVIVTTIAQRSGAMTGDEAAVVL